LDKISVSMTINATAPILVAFLIVLAKKRGHELEELRGTVQNDILKEFIARGTQIYDLDFSLRYSTDLSEFCIKNLPNFNWASISGYHIREAGATAVQELAFTFLNARVYFNALVERGLSIESILKRTSFFFDCMMDFFEEIAKFRAAREIYAHIVKDEYGCNDERCQKLKFHTQTGGSALTAQGYYNNIIRACIQCLAAVLGGTQSLHCSSFDEALGLPTEESALVALRTQQIIRYETGIPSVTDPLGGSFYIEYLTNEIKKKVRSLMSEIDNLGTLRCIKNGYIKKLIEDSAYKIQKRIEEKDQIIVGVNMFEEFSRPSDFFYVDDQETKDIISRLVNFKRTRNIQKVNVAREQLSNAKRSGHNLMEYIINAVENECTLGEITDALRQ
ncbi:MAG: methylmalonyl-CoA mutase family protein, partial [Deltaproteobacteria bacterium]|nr:methylmalonyl-CoA mutase family protein [Deltaproteobacteria bacterium]